MHGNTALPLIIQFKFVKNAYKNNQRIILDRYSRICSFFLIKGGDVYNTSDTDYLQQVNKTLFY